MDTFIEGLILEIWCEVKARQPRTMIAAISFAHLHEKKINRENHGNRNDNNQMISKSLAPSIPNQSLDTRRLTQEELNERLAKGLHYDEKWSMEHQCKQGQHIMIEPIGEEPKPEELDSDYEGVETNEDIEAITHTVHALASYANPQTMKIRRTLKH